MQVSIRKFDVLDIPRKVQWINNPANNTFLHYDLPLEEDKTHRWFEAIRDRTDRYDAVIEADGTPVGLIGLLQIDSKNRKAEFYISMGEVAYKGKGVAKAATWQLLTYAFRILQLNKVYFFTETANLAAQKMLERVGFRQEGLLKDDLIYNGKKVDRFSYGILAEEFFGLSDDYSETAASV